MLILSAPLPLVLNPLKKEKMQVVKSSYFPVQGSILKPPGTKWSTISIGALVDHWLINGHFFCQEDSPFST
jgi:hypothetical protein